MENSMSKLSSLYETYRPADVKKLERGPLKRQHPELGRHGFAIFQRKIPKPFF